jgi:molybdate transport system ATP-binding protein
MIQVRMAAFGLEVEFQAAAGITALFGPANAGKTLILDAIAGLLAPRTGRIILDDEILFDGASPVSLPPRRRHCGYVSRHWALFPHMSLRDNLLFPVAHLARLERRRRVNEML